MYKYKNTASFLESFYELVGLKYLSSNNLHFLNRHDSSHPPPLEISFQDLIILRIPNRMTIFFCKQVTLTPGPNRHSLRTRLVMLTWVLPGKMLIFNLYIILYIFPIISKKRKAVLIVNVIRVNHGN